MIVAISGCTDSAILVTHEVPVEAGRHARIWCFTPQNCNDKHLRIEIYDAKAESHFGFLPVDKLAGGPLMGQLFIATGVETHLVIKVIGRDVISFTQASLSPTDDLTVVPLSKVECAKYLLSYC